jgi:hypothetical protein
MCAILAWMKAFMTRKQVTELMRSSRTREEWSTNYLAVIAALGYRPPYWNLDIVESGVMVRSMRAWPTYSAGADASFVGGRETPLEAALRHVREATERVMRQEVIVALLDKHRNYRSQAALAKEILASLRKSLDAMKGRLRAIQGCSKS